MSQLRKEFSERQGEREEGFIRIGCLQGSQVDRQALSCPEYSVAYIFIIRRREGRARRSLSFLRRHHISIISSSPKLAGKFTCPCLYDQARTVRAPEKYFWISVQRDSFILKSYLSINDYSLCAQGLFWGSLTWWHHWAGCRPICLSDSLARLTIIYLVSKLFFLKTLKALSQIFLASSFVHK